MKNVTALKRTTFLSRRHLNKAEKKHVQEVLDEIEKRAEVRFFKKEGGDFIEAIYENRDGYWVSNRGRWRIWFHPLDSGTYRFNWLLEQVMHYATEDEEMPF